ncbi:MAG: MFS transporter [Promethearchaeota archaeon]
MKKREILSLICFLMLILIIIMDNPIFLPNQVLVAADLKIYFDSIGLLIGAYTIINGIFIIISGYLTDKYERKLLLIVSGFIWSATVIFYLFITQYWQLFLERMLAAIATGFTTPVTISYIADMVSQKSRSKSFAIWGLISAVASVFASIFALSFNTIDFESISGLSINEKINYIRTNFPNQLYTWKLPYLLLGITALIITTINIFLTVEPKRGSKDLYLKESLSDEMVKYTYKIRLSDFKNLFKRKSNIFLTINFFDVVASGLLLAYIFPYIELEIGINVIDARVLVLLLFAGIFGLFLGQFILAHWGDKKVQKGDVSGRVKVAVICSILTLPFLLIAFSMSPNATNDTFFFNAVKVNDVGFWILWIVYCSFLGIGLAFTMGIGPNWYSSLIDLNLPENRGSIVAIGSFVDSIGRSMGAIMGGFIVHATQSFSATIFWSTLIFGILSIFLWVPLFYTTPKDFEYIHNILKERSLNLKEQRKD